MTVAELIKLLERLPQNGKVYTWDRFSGGYEELDREYIIRAEFSGTDQIFL